MANQLKTPFALIMGEDEWKKEKCIVKNLNTGNQKVVQLKSLIGTLEKYSGLLRIIVIFVSFPSLVRKADMNFLNNLKTK